MLAAPGPSSTRAAANTHAWHAVRDTPASQITLVPTESPLALAVAQEGGQQQLPRFAACVGAPGGWLRVRLIRCTNAAPIAHDGQVSQVVAAQCVCAVASQPGSTARSGVVRGDSSGGAEWDETLWLPLPLGSIALHLELRLSVRDAAQRSQCAPMALLPRTGKATVPLRGASGSCWCAVRGSGPPRSDGEPAGSAELLLEYWRLQPEVAEAAAGAAAGAAEAEPGAAEAEGTFAGGSAESAAEAGPGSSEGGGAEPGGRVPVGKPKAPKGAVATRGAAECGGGKPRPVVLLDDRGFELPGVELDTYRSMATHHALRRRAQQRAWGVEEAQLAVHGAGTLPLATLQHLLARHVHVHAHVPCICLFCACSPGVRHAATPRCVRVRPCCVPVRVRVHVACVRPREACMWRVRVRPVQA